MRALTDAESNALVDSGLGLDVDEYAFLDGEEGFVVRRGRQIAWELDGGLSAFEMDSEAEVQAKFQTLVAEHGS